MAFERPVLKSQAFWGFWEDFEPVSDRDAAIEGGESVLTGVLEDAGFTWRCWCPDAEVFADVISNTQGYLFPYEMLAVGNPLIKKKCVDMAAKEQLDGVVRALGQLRTAHPALGEVAEAAARARTTDELLERSR